MICESSGFFFHSVEVEKNNAMMMISVCFVDVWIFFVYKNVIIIIITKKKRIYQIFMKYDDFYFNSNYILF